MYTNENTISYDNVINKLSIFKSRYLASAINKLYINHPELQEEIQGLVDNAVQNKLNDKSNDLLENANFPMYPEHYTFKDFDDSCIFPEQKEDYDQLVSLSFLDSRSQPNLILFGPPDQGKEKLAIALGDKLCRERHSVLFIDYHKFVEILSTHGHVASSNNSYKSMLSVECLIIDDFAGQNIYDADLIDAIDVFIKERVEKQVGKHAKKWKPCVTYVTTCYSPNDWCNYLIGSDMKVISIINKLYGMGCTLNIDETNISEGDEHYE